MDYFFLNLVFSLIYFNSIVAAITSVTTNLCAEKANVVTLLIKKDLKDLTGEH